MKASFLFTQLVIFLFGILFIAGCGSDSESGGGNVVIKLVDDTKNSLAQLSHADMFPPSFDNGFQIFATPTALNSFDCFGINITGEGVPPNPNIGSNCVSVDNFNQRGLGITPPMIPGLGKSITAAVPVGSARTFDVYGMSPAPSDCPNSVNLSNNSMTAYLLGSKTVDVTDDASITIPLSFTNGQASNFTCTYSNAPQFSATDGGTYTSSSTIGSPSPDTAEPIIVTGSVLSSLSNTNTDDSTYGRSELSGPTSFIAMTEFYFTINNSDLANYPNVTVKWKGRSGIYGTSCDGVTTTLTVAGGSVYVLNYNSGSPSWVNIGSTTNLSTDQFFSQTVLASTYGVPGASSKYFFVRVISPTPSSGQCGVNLTNFLQIQLSP